LKKLEERDKKLLLKKEQIEKQQTENQYSVPKINNKSKKLLQNKENMSFLLRND